MSDPGALSLIWAVEPWHWMTLGLVLLIAELMTGSTYLLWPAVGAWLTGLLALLLPTDFGAEILAFGASTILLTIFARPYFRGRWLASGDNALNAPAAALIGKVAVADAAFVDGSGRVRLGDTVWLAECAEPVAAETRVEVIGVEGATLKVRLKV